MSHDPPRYERLLPDGTLEVFTVADRPAHLPWRRVFLSQVVDRQGQQLQFTYDASFRLVAVTDALGRVTVVSYEHADPYKITKVTDPFGRFALLSYTAAGQLAVITDQIGLTSTFTYGASDFIASMTTPYGTSTFGTETLLIDSSPARRLELTDPMGGTERLEFRFATPAIPSQVPANEVPAGIPAAANVYLDHYNSFYWNTRAMALSPGDVTKATIINWLIAPEWSTYPASRAVPHSVKRPLESRIWFRYPGQSANAHHDAGWGRSPSLVARVLDDGTTATWQRTFNTRGYLTSRTDPLGRQTTYSYDANGMDLLEVRQTSPGIDQLLASFANYTASTHRPGL